MNTPIRQRKRVTALNAAAVAAPSSAINVSAYRQIVVSIGLSSTANMTLQFLGSSEESAPDFTTTKSETNRYENILVKDRENDQGIAGDIGLVITAPGGNGDSRLVEINTNQLDWLAIDVFSFTTGTVTAIVTGVSNA